MIRLGQYAKARYIAPYGEKPFRNVLGTRLDRRWDKIGYGLEIELNFRNPQRDDSEECVDLKALLDSPGKHLKTHYVWKEDGSISGAELVTAPLTLNRWKTINLKDCLRRLWEHGARGYNNQCGLHIHRSRPDLSYTDIMNIRRFIIVNSSRLVTFCKRRSDYAIVPTDITDGWTQGHRDALNVTRKTLEWRMCKGTTDYDRVKASLLMFDAFVSFVLSFTPRKKQLTAEILPRHASESDSRCYAKYRYIYNTLHWDNFIRYLTSRGTEYSFLIRYLKRENLYSLDQ